MNKIILVVTLLASFSDYGDALEVGCIKQTPICSSAGKCSWAAGLGQIVEIELSKKGSGPSYEIWEGKTTLALSGQPFELEVYQRREAGEDINYLTIGSVGLPFFMIDMSF